MRTMGVRARWACLRGTSGIPGTRASATVLGSMEPSFSPSQPPAPSPTLPTLVPLPRPARGGCTRVRLGSAEVILEAVRGGHSLLWTNGRDARRYAVGLHRDGQLTLQLRAPRLAVHVVPREVVGLVPGGRLAGYVAVSLVPTIVWHQADGASQVLLELHPADLAAEWDEAHGHSFTTASAWLVRFPMRNGEPRAVVPVRLHNPTRTIASPPAVPLLLRDDELTELRGCIVARPRRLVWSGDRLVPAARAAAGAGATPLEEAS
jgi:hypothetical protein